MPQLSLQQFLELAMRHHGAGRLDEAEQIYRQILDRVPDNSAAIHLLGVVALQRGNNQAAVDLIGRAIALNPNFPEAQNNLGIALKNLGRFDQAIAACTKAISLRPNYANALYNLGAALQSRGDLREAIDCYRRTIALVPDYVEAHTGLGNALKDIGRPDDAIAAYKQSIVLRPAYFEAHANLGTALRGQGRFDEAIAASRHAIALKPDDPLTHDSLILSLNYHPDIDARAMARELAHWSRQHADPVRALVQSHATHPNDRNPDRRLRIGYVSADFCDHASAHFLLPLLQNHDPRQVEVTAYAHVPCPDAITKKLQGFTARWRSTVARSDDEVAEQIRQDRIDILVDLKLHSAQNRLLVFARKPAPVQATWLGYPGSTGLSEIDYRLTDPYLDPPGVDETVYAEKTFRLPETFWCYDPLEGRDIPVTPLPAATTGSITFGCLNTSSKFNQAILSLWARVLGKVDGSRLLLLVPPGSQRSSIQTRFRHDGIDPSRIEFLPRQSRLDYMKTYGRVDICLDSFPVNGHTTSLDSFWMGVPVITLVGPMLFARAGWSELSNLGLSELAAHTPEQFVQIAADLAADLARLQSLRQTLRTRMEKSPLMDGPRFARNMEAAYRRMWRTWCEKSSDDS